MVESFAPFFELEKRRDGEFVARLADFGGRSFGGDLLARAVLAAADGDRRELHALHATFLRPAPAGVPISLVVDRLGDGRRLARRRVRVEHDGRQLCAITASFAAASDGLRYQGTLPDPTLPAADSLPSTRELARAEGWLEYAGGPIEFRRIGEWSRLPQMEGPVAKLGWMAPRTPLPAEPAMHAAALAYLSDFLSHWAVEVRLGPAFSPEGLLSLDHALWVHRPPRWDDWWLVDTRTDIAHAGRALTRREVYDRGGQLIASIVQEALVTTSG